MATNGNLNHGGAEAFATPTTDGSGSTSNLSKDEVGWYFVEQFYTTLSKSPEKLHLFYGKRSQFVNGLEAEVANVSVGRQAIQERIKVLDFQDCKVRISNVDSQASQDNIVIQVIGETSNKAGTPKKFVQTFVLAQQPSGYFVLNDILRYVKEDVEEEAEDVAEGQEDAPAVEPTTAPEPAGVAEPEAEAPKSVESSHDEEAAALLDTTVVDQKLQEVGTQDVPPSPSIESPVETAAPAEKIETIDPEKAVQEIAKEDTIKLEVPQDPAPTPVAPRAATPAAAEPEKPKGPPKPMTWASRAAAAAGPARPVVPIPKIATPPTTAPVRAPAPAASASTAPAALVAAPQGTPTSPSTAAPKDQDDWQPARADAKRQNRPQSISRPPTEKEGAMAYIKYVTETVKEEDLRSALASYGELAYFDINRQKNCAFVEFATPAGYNAAVAANPHVVNGENIVVEQRRPKANAYGGSNYSAGRGGTANRGRGGFDNNRPGSQGGPRGGFTGQTRGRGGGAPRGRGASQTANA